MTCVLHRSCIWNCELDIRIFNNLIWIYKAQVMVNFLGLPQLRLFIFLRPDLGLISKLSSELSYGLDMDLFVACVWLVLWPNYGLLWIVFGLNLGLFYVLLVAKSCGRLWLVAWPKF